MDHASEQVSDMSNRFAAEAEPKLPLLPSTEKYENKVESINHFLFKKYINVTSFSSITYCSNSEYWS